MKKALFTGILTIFLTGCILGGGENPANFSPIASHATSSAPTVSGDTSPITTPMHSVPTGDITPTPDNIANALKYADYLSSFDIAKGGDGWWVRDNTLTIVADYGMADWYVFKKSYERFGREEYNARIAAQIEHIILQEDVTSIPYEGFYGLYALKTIDLPNSLLVIGEDSFGECETLEKIDIPNSVLETMDGAFIGCGSLTEIRFPSQMKTLRSYVLISCTALEELHIPANVETVEEYALAGTHIKRIVFEGTVKEFDGMDYYDIESLQQLVFLSEPPSKLGIDILYKSNATIYYLSKNKHLWSPHGETEWLGRPLVAINSLDDLPPLD